MVKVNTQELLKVLNNTPSEQNIMLAGAHGIGKSKILTDFYKKEKKLPVIAFFLGQMSDPGDLIGLMHKNRDTGKSEFLPPYWWPLEDKPVVLFLDELNRARPEILQSVMDLTLNRTLAGKSLPSGSIVISAINNGDHYQITDLDPALVSRFNLYEFSPTQKDWIIWATDTKIDKRVIAFIQKNPIFLDTANEFKDGEKTDETDLEKTPDRRAWERVSNLIKNQKVIDNTYVKIIAGIVGISASVNFRKSIKDVAKLDPDKILFKFNLDMFKGLKLQDFILANDQLVLLINNNKYNKPKTKKMVTNLIKYIQFMKLNKLQEGVAHFASLLENPNFEKVLGFVFGESEELASEISEYIKEIGL